MLVHSITNETVLPSPALAGPQQTNIMSPALITEESGANGDDASDVVVVGAGPAGLMLAANLVRFGIKTTILDDRPDKTATGRADGLQPKSIETLRQMRLADPLLQKGVRIYDICFWGSTADTPLRRTGREVHYPPVVDLLDPYILLVHQGMVEDVFLDDLKSRGIEVSRSSPFIEYTQPDGDAPLQVTSLDTAQGKQKQLHTQYLVGCDGAHSQVRKCIPDARAEGYSSEAIWGVLDGVIDSDFPDLWSKVVVYSEQAGNVLCIPRERNMTRLYIELRPESHGPMSKAQATQEFVMQRAREIMKPYTLKWDTVEWFGIYQIGQRVANRFTDDAQRVFIAGDASHTHSPKAAQGMNTSMHDSLNLAWKLNLAIRNLAKPSLLATYEHERRKIAHDLINFDYEHANAFHDGDVKALAQNFLTNVRFISGVGAEYAANVLNLSPENPSVSRVQPGCLLPPAKVTRYVDANPVDIQLDIPPLGQFRVYFLCRQVVAVRPFLTSLCYHLTSSSSVVGRTTAAARASYASQPPLPTQSDAYVQPQRYTAVSDLFTFALVTSTPKADFEIDSDDHLPPLLQTSKWTVYLDDVPHMDTKGMTCIDKWIGQLGESEVVAVNVRPDGYVGAIGRWSAEGNDTSAAVAWLEDYYGRFLL